MGAGGEQIGPGRALVVGAAIVVIVAGLRVASSIMVPFIVSVFLAVVTRPPLRWLEERGVPLAVGVPLVMLGALVFLLLMALLLAASAAQFTDALPFYQERINQILADVTLFLQQHGADVSHVKISDYINVGAAMSLVGTMFSTLASTLSDSVLVVITTVFILFEAAGFPRKLRAMLGHAEDGMSQVRKATREVQRYLLIKTGVSLATGVLIGAWCFIVGLDFPLLWGILAFLLNYIPNIGSILAAIPAILLALIQIGFGHALLVALGYVVVNMVIGNWIEPKLTGRTLGLSALVVFLSLIFWGWLWGPVGMLLSVPLTVSAKILFEHSDDLRWIAILLGPATEET